MSLQAFIEDRSKLPIKPHQILSAEERLALTKSSDLAGFWLVAQTWSLIFLLLGLAASYPGSTHILARSGAFTRASIGLGGSHARGGPWLTVCNVGVESLGRPMALCIANPGRFAQLCRGSLGASPKSRYP